MHVLFLCYLCFSVLFFVSLKIYYIYIYINITCTTHARVCFITSDWMNLLFRSAAFNAAAAASESSFVCAM